MKARASEVFVGRLRELEELERALDASRTRSGATVLVAGEAGIGKTRLVSELESRAHDAGFEVLVGRAIDLVGTELPYQPFVDSLRPLGDPRQVDEQKAGSQLHVFENTLALLTDRAAAAPVLLVLEDLHWADTSTLDLVVFLAATSPTVGCCCSLLRSMSTNGPWRSTRHEWEREPGRTYPLTLRFVVERVTGIEPALSAWELDCHASADQHVAGQSLCPVVHEYPLSTDRTPSIGHAAGTLSACHVRGLKLPWLPAPGLVSCMLPLRTTDPGGTSHQDVWIALLAAPQARLRLRRRAAARAIPSILNVVMPTQVALPLLQPVTEARRGCCRLVCCSCHPLAPPYGKMRVQRNAAGP